LFNDKITSICTLLLILKFVLNRYWNLFSESNCGGAPRSRAAGHEKRRRQVS